MLRTTGSKAIRIGLMPPPPPREPSLRRPPSALPAESAENLRQEAHDDLLGCGVRQAAPPTPVWSSAYNAWAQSLIHAHAGWADTCMNQEVGSVAAACFILFSGGTMDNPSTGARPDSDPSRTTTSSGTRPETTWTAERVRSVRARPAGWAAVRTVAAVRAGHAVAAGRYRTPSPMPRCVDAPTSMDAADAVGRNAVAPGRRPGLRKTRAGGGVPDSAQDLPRPATRSAPAGQKDPGHAGKAVDLRAMGSNT